MSKQYPGGFISKTAPTLNPALGSAASGVWTMNQVAYAVQTNTWPPFDPYYKNVTLNLHGNGTNAAQNNTFLDSSTNNFTITRNGNTTQGTFTPYGSNWSNYFDGTGDYLTASTVAGDFGSSAFTMEAWVFFNSVSGTQVIGSTYQSSSVGWNFGKSNSTGCFFVGLSGDGNDINGTTTVAVGTWYHVAVSGTPGTGIKLFVNGVQEGSTYTGAVSLSATVPVYVGDLSALGYVVNGYISNFRLVKNTAVYTSNFTPSTTPLTAISGTSLLTCQSNRFVDVSTNAYTITVTGNVAVQRFNPFGTSTAYDTSVIGGSGYFDGATDYLSAANATALQLSGNQFTIEGWFYLTVGSTDNNEIVSQTSGSPDANVNFMVRVTSANQLRFLVMSGTSPTYFDSTVTITTNSWHYFACVCDGSGAGAFLRMWVNGVYQTASSSFNASGINTNTAATQIGAWTFASQYVTGYITDLRILKGTALYTGTSNITVPTAPLTAITNTSLLLSYTNAGILDNAMMNDLETVGNAQISTSVVKYGTGSMSFDGTDDRLTSASSPNIAFRTGDFTVEAWIYTNTLSGERGFIQTSDTAGGLKTTYTTGITINIDISPYKINCNIGGTGVNSGTTYVAINTWYHVALTRASGSVRLFINGALVGGPTTITTDLTGQNICVGGYYNTSYLWNGYIDDLRITKYARYVAAFTAPTSQLQDQ